MARKDVFANITGPNSQPHERKATPGYASRGASRSMINSLGELAEKAARVDQLLEGEAVVELPPGLIDGSFVSDRMEEDDEAFSELLEAIRARGQDTPVLVRPHPSIEGRYQTVFGHRRVRAARQLDRPVRAVIRSVADIDHVIAQGQENSARENLSFIERAMFAHRLSTLGYERPTIQLALSADAPMLTRMLSVASRIPAELVAAIGPAKGIGRDRWLDLAQAVERPRLSTLALQMAAQPEFLAGSSEQRFEMLAREMKRASRPAKKPPATASWEAENKALAAEFKSAGKNFSVTLKSRDAGKFGRFLSANMDRLYAEFSRDEPQGD